jgi:hypothetical protein
MTASAATTVEAYLDSLPPERQHVLAAVRAVILANLPAGYQEGMQYGMIGYFVPLERYPITYNKQPLSYAALAAQKNYLSLYLNCVYGSAELRAQFEAAYRQSGKRLDMGKSCVRFKRLDDLPLDLVGRTIAATPVDQYIAHYEQFRAATARGK